MAVPSRAPAIVPTIAPKPDRICVHDRAPSPSATIILEVGSTPWRSARASTSLPAQLGASCTDAHVPTNATPLKHAPSSIRRIVGPTLDSEPPDAAPARFK